MPNKRNKNRKSITIHLSEERQNELNEYLNCQKNLKDSIELAILICKKSFGLRDLATAYQDYSLNHMKMNISDINASMPEQKQIQQTPISSTPEVSSERNLNLRSERKKKSKQLLNEKNHRSLNLVKMLRKNQRKINLIQVKLINCFLEGNPRIYNKNYNKKPDLRDLAFFYVKSSTIRCLTLFFT